MGRETLQHLFVRICRDSGFKLDAMDVAVLVAKIAGTSPLMVWQAMPSLRTMDEIAAGKHPACGRYGK